MEALSYLEKYKQVLFLVLSVLLSFVIVFNLGLLLKVVGLYYSARFIYTKLLFAEDRKTFFESLRKIYG